jgi:hypothetical protein
MDLHDKCQLLWDRDSLIYRVNKLLAAINPVP